jgi:hypothetical protein
MPANITERELTLLQYLNDRSGVMGGRIGLDPQRIRRDLRISLPRLAEDSAALTALGLAGMRYARARSDDVALSTTCSAVWVTSKGQAYLRRARRPTPAICEAPGEAS